MGRKHGTSWVDPRPEKEAKSDRDIRVKLTPPEDISRPDKGVLSEDVDSPPGPPEDVSFTSVADELSELLNKSSIERHLSGQLECSSDRDPHHFELETTQKGHTKPPPHATRYLPSYAHSTTSSSTLSTHTSADSRAHGIDTKRDNPKNPLLVPTHTQSSECHFHKTKVPPRASHDSNASVSRPIETGTESPLSLDLNNLALQVRDKLTSIFDQPSSSNEKVSRVCVCVCVCVCMCVGVGRCVCVHTTCVWVAGRCIHIRAHESIYCMCVFSSKYYNS